MGRRTADQSIATASSRVLFVVLFTTMIAVVHSENLYGAIFQQLLANAVTPPSPAPAPTTAAASSYRPYTAATPTTAVPRHMIRPLVQSDIRNCTDLDCGQEQCCIEAADRGFICVDMVVLNATSGERNCQRLKSCKRDTDCLPGTCCVYNTYVTADTTCPPGPGPGYPPHSMAGQVVAPVKGICMATSTVNGTCVLPLDSTSTCQCGTGLTCTATVPGTVHGTCIVN